MMRAVVQWRDGLAFDAEADSGHVVRIDASPAAGGSDSGSRPMELVLLGVGGCSSIDVLSFLRKAREDVTDCRCELDAERADGIPAVFTRIRLHFVVTGRGLSEHKVARAVRLSAEKYCSASIMLTRAGVEITHTHEVVEAA